MTDVHAIRLQLAAYLGAEVTRIAILGSGWETTIYEFTIGARSARAPDLPIHSPLVLRLYDGERAEDKAAREGATLSWLAGAAYPVPRPYVRELSRDALGAPFIIMDRVAGGPLFSATSFPLAFKTFSLGFIAFVRAQVRLHRIDLSGRDPHEPNALYVPHDRHDRHDPNAAPRAVSNASPPAAPLPSDALPRTCSSASPPAPTPDAHSRALDAPLPAPPATSLIDAPRAADALPRAFTRASIPATAPLLDRILAIIAERVASGPLPGLADALASLRDRADHYRPAPHTPPAPDTLPATHDALAASRDRADRYRTAPESIVHMDYHPQNVIVRGIRVTGVIDWVSADRGDRHLDAATTAVILATSAMDRPRWMRDNRVGNSLRALFAALYFPAYHALAPMDFERYRYCQAVAALFRLSTFGMMRARGPASVGFRPEAIANVTPDVLRLLTRYAARKSGLPVTLAAPQ